MGVTMNYGAAPTYVRIANQSASGVSSVTFNNIPQGYTDLVIVSYINSARGTNLDSFAVRFNGDTGNNYSYTLLQGNTSSGVSSSRQTSQSNIFVGNFAASSASNNFSTNTLNVQDYSNSTKFKNTLSRGGAITSAVTDVEMVSGLWANTAPITSITLRSETGSNFNAGSTFTIYGIDAAFVPKASGGDVIVQDGTYWYHAFRTTGAFVPNQSLTADVLVVAGGGGGGDAGYGGGGGAGGLLAYTSQSLTTTRYAVTVGSGGAKAAAGSNSQFASLTASVGGGAGASNAAAAPAVGGSGGGGNGNFPRAGIAGTAGQGNAGGSGDGGGGAYKSLGGGGGGAGGSGANATSSAAGNGGAGVSTYSTWATVTSTGSSGFYAGGGGGGANDSSGYTAGTGGSGGGGAGSRLANHAAPGTAATGGGGGGSGQQFNAGGGHGGAGGSGLVIVRYPI